MYRMSTSSSSNVMGLPALPRQKQEQEQYPFKDGKYDDNVPYDEKTDYEDDGFPSWIEIPRGHTFDEDEDEASGYGSDADTHDVPSLLKSNTALTVDTSRDENDDHYDSHDRVYNDDENSECSHDHADDRMPFVAGPVNIGVHTVAIHPPAFRPRNGSVFWKEHDEAGLFRYSLSSATQDSHGHSHSYDSRDDNDNDGDDESSYMPATFYNKAALMKDGVYRTETGRVVGDAQQYEGFKNDNILDENDSLFDYYEYLYAAGEIGSV